MLDTGRTKIHPLRQARLDRNLSQQMLADFTCLSLPTIKRAESGKPLRVDVHQRLCEFFGKTSKELGLCHSQGKDSIIDVDEEQPKTQVPFSDGRLLWTLHLGIQDDRLQCIISCPLATGELWEVVLDSDDDGTGIQGIYRLIQEQVMIKGIKPARKRAG